MNHQRFSAPEPCMARLEMDRETLDLDQWLFRFGLH
jgi:hypothetical protein